MKILFLILGSLSLLLGIIGIIVPGLPTTVFVLIAAYFYLKSSEKLYNWLLNQKHLGKHLRDYKTKKAFSKQAMIKAIFIMWMMISASVIFLIDVQIIQIIIFALGIIGTIVMSRVKTFDDKNDCE